MSKVFYDNVIRTEGMKSERVEMTVDIYESADTVRDHDIKTDINTQQPLQHTGSERVMKRSYRSVSVCLVLLCVLLLTAVIVLCVLIYTNNQQFNIKTKNITEERNQLLTKYTNLTEERDQLLTKYANITEERDELIAKYNNINKLSEQLKAINKLWTRRYDGWIYFKSSLYFISSEKKSWTESRRYCRERGADLIIINNKEEQDFVQKVSDNEYIWIGLSDSDEEGRWKWVDNSTLNSSFWTSKEPDGEGNCALSDNSEWHADSCHEAHKWICEKKLTMFTKNILKVIKKLLVPTVRFNINSKVLE